MYSRNAVSNRVVSARIEWRSRNRPTSGLPYAAAPRRKPGTRSAGTIEGASSRPLPANAAQLVRGHAEEPARTAPAGAEHDHRVLHPGDGAVDVDRGRVGVGEPLLRVVFDRMTHHLR